jgi:hypothetical protein
MIENATRQSAEGTARQRTKNDLAWPSLLARPRHKGAPKDRDRSAQHCALIANRQSGLYDFLLDFDAQGADDATGVRRRGARPSQPGPMQHIVVGPVTGSDGGRRRSGRRPAQSLVIEIGS